MRFQKRGALLLVVLLPGACAFLYPGLPPCWKPAAYPACAHTHMRRSARPQCLAPLRDAVMCLDSDAAACTSPAVEVSPATDQMFGSLAQLRVGELSQNFKCVFV